MSIHVYVPPLDHLWTLEAWDLEAIWYVFFPPEETFILGLRDNNLLPHLIFVTYQPLTSYFVFLFSSRSSLGGGWFWGLGKVGNGKTKGPEWVPHQKGVKTVNACGVHRIRTPWRKLWDCQQWAFFVNNLDEGFTCAVDAKFSLCLTKRVVSIDIVLVFSKCAFGSFNYPGILFWASYSCFLSKIVISLWFDFLCFVLLHVYYVHSCGCACV